MCYTLDKASNLASRDSVAIVGPANPFDCPTSFMGRRLCIQLASAGMEAEYVSFDLRPLIDCNLLEAEHVRAAAEPVLERIRQHRHLILQLDQRYWPMVPAVSDILTRLVLAADRAVITLDYVPDLYTVSVAIGRAAGMLVRHGRNGYAHLRNQARMHKAARVFWTGCRNAFSRDSLAFMVNNPFRGRQLKLRQRLPFVMHHPLVFFTQAEAEEIRHNAQATPRNTEGSSVHLATADFLDVHSNLANAIEALFGAPSVHLKLLVKERAGDVPHLVPVPESVGHLLQAIDNGRAAIESSRSNLLSKDERALKRLETRLSLHDERLGDQRQALADEIEMVLGNIEKHEDRVDALNTESNVEFSYFRDLEDLAGRMAESDAVIVTRIQTFEDFFPATALALQFGKRILLSHVPVHQQLSGYWANRIPMFDIGNTAQLRNAALSLSRGEPDPNLAEYRKHFDLASYAECCARFLNGEKVEDRFQV